MEADPPKAGAHEFPAVLRGCPPSRVAPERPARGSRWTDAAIVVALLVVAAATRWFILGLAFDREHFSDWPDSQQYVSVARNIALGNGWTNSWQPDPAKQPEIPFGDVGPTSFREPGFPALIAAAFLVRGAVPTTILELNVLVQSLTVACVYVLARRLGGSRPQAAIAAAITAIHPYFFATTGLTAIESTVGLALVAVATAATFAMPDCAGRGRWAPWLLLGAALGAGMNTRAIFGPLSVVLFAAVFLLGLRQGPREALRRAGTVALVAMLSLTPWIARNWSVWGRPVYVTSVGMNLLIGFNDDARVGYTGTAIEAAAREAKARGLNELEADAFYREKALSWVKEHPFDAARLVALREAAFWQPWPNNVDDLQALVATMAEFAFLAFAAAGAVLVLRRRRQGDMTIVALVACYATVLPLAYAVTRYRVPLVPLLAVLAATAGAEGFRRIRDYLSEDPPEGAGATS